MYLIADFYINIKCRTEYFKKRLVPYYINDDKSLLQNASTDDETLTVKKDNKIILDISGERAFVLEKIAELLPLHNAFVLHSACFDVEGVGVAFAAHSGTGKTTHMNLWQKLLGDKMVVVNGDKPIVRFFDDEPNTLYAYGTPWNGKENLGCNMRTPLKHICFIERSDTNYVEPMKKEDVIDRIFNQIYMPKDPVAVMNTMQLIDRLLSCCKLWTIHCNMEEEAAKIAYEAIFEMQSAKCKINVSQSDGNIKCKV